ncbi:MAG TPA: hypothetical protein VFV38_35465 [Ktedonobacteraceae bacterium]|nr:hypothetical protein [Ktedonobacteraceae bacterium]
MESQPTSRRWSLEALLAHLRQRYPAACLSTLETPPDQVVLQLDHFTITMSTQGLVEVCAPLNAHARVEHLARVIEQFLQYEQDHASEHPLP